MQGVIWSELHAITYLIFPSTHEVNAVFIPILKIMKGGGGRLNNISKRTQLISDGVRI